MAAILFRAQCVCDFDYISADQMPILQDIVAFLIDAETEWESAWRLQHLLDSDLLQQCLLEHRF